MRINIKPSELGRLLLYHYSDFYCFYETCQESVPQAFEAFFESTSFEDTIRNAISIGGFNAMIEKQKKQDGECYVSTVLFDNVSEVLHDRAKLSEIKPMTDRDYTVRGCTALIEQSAEQRHLSQTGATKSTKIMFVGVKKDKNQSEPPYYTGVCFRPKSF